MSSKWPTGWISRLNAADATCSQLIAEIQAGSAQDTLDLLTSEVEALRDEMRSLIAAYNQLLAEKIPKLNMR